MVDLEIRTDGGETERDKAHVKMLVEATMGEVCSQFNPELEKAFANLVSFRNHIETTVDQHGGWQPGILQAVIDSLDFEAIGQELDEFSVENFRGLAKVVDACLDKGINQQTVFRAIDEFVEEERQSIESEYGMRLE